MPHFLDNTVIYHIPKTGGTWLTKCMEDLFPQAKPFGLKHAPPDYIQMEWESHPNPGVKNPLEMHKVACVRHPLAWLRSYWRFREGLRIGLPETGPWIPFYANHITEDLDACGDRRFQKYVCNYLERCPGFVSRLYRQWEECTLFVPGASHALIKQLREWGETCPPAEALEGIPPQLVSAGPQVDWPMSLAAQVLDVEQVATEMWQGAMR